MIRTVERMGGAVYTEDLVAKQVNTIYLSFYINVYSCQACVYTKCYMVAKQERKEKIYEMMRQGDWRAVCKEFHVRQFTKLLDLKYIQPCLKLALPRSSETKTYFLEGGRVQRTTACLGSTIPGLAHSSSQFPSNN